MKAASAIQKFFRAPGTRKDEIYMNATVSEIKEFKKACTDSEWQRLGKQACEILGEKYER